MSKQETLVLSGGKLSFVLILKVIGDTLGEKTQAVDLAQIYKG